MRGNAVNARSSETPNRSRPRRPEPVKKSDASCCAAMMALAKPAMASPSAVSVTVLVSRRNRGRPTAASSFRMCWLTVGWPSPRSFAALVKLSVFATASSVRSCSGSNMASSCPLQNVIAFITSIKLGDGRGSAQDREVTDDLDHVGNAIVLPGAVPEVHDIDRYRQRLRRDVQLATRPEFPNLPDRAADLERRRLDPAHRAGLARADVDRHRDGGRCDHRAAVPA